MPQMAPLMWMNLFIFFSLSFLFFNILNFYNFKYTPSSKKFLNNVTFFTKNNFLWKW